MKLLSDFAEKNYVLFAIISVFLVFALIGYFIEKKNTEKKLSNDEELKTLNIQNQVNQMNSQNSTMNTANQQPTQNNQVMQQIPPQPVPAQDTMRSNQEQPVPVDQVAQQPAGNTNQKGDGNIEILG